MKHRESKRRKGNQGDWAKTQELTDPRVLAKYRDWNAEVEARKLAKKRRNNRPAQDHPQ